MLKKLKENKLLRIFVKLVKTICILGLILIISITFVQKVSNNKVTLKGFSLFTIITKSMEPVYNVGDMVLAKKKNINEIKIGDDIVYLGEEDDFKDKIVTHRVVNIHKNNGKIIFHTQGLNNYVEDPEVHENQVIGVVVYRCVILSIISNIVNSNYGLYFVVFVPLSIMLFFEIVAIIKTIK